MLFQLLPPQQPPPPPPLLSLLLRLLISRAVTESKDVFPVQHS
jgi:hypothetical protein